MDSNFEQFAAEASPKYQPKLLRQEFFSFRNANGKLFVFPKTEAVAFIRAWTQCLSIVESELGEASPNFSYSERPFRRATKRVIQESGFGADLSTIGQISESQTLGLFNALDIFIRTALEDSDVGEPIAMSRHALERLDAPLALLNVEPSDFNSVSRQRGGDRRPELVERDAFGFTNSNVKSFWIPVPEINAFVESWHDNRAHVESVLGSQDNSDLYAYHEPKFREAASLVFAASGREIEMSAIHPMLRSQTPGLFEIINLYVRWVTNSPGALSSIALSHQAVTRFLAERGTTPMKADTEELRILDAPVQPIPDPLGPSEALPTDDAPTRRQVVIAILERDSTVLGRTWRAHQEHGQDAVRIRDAIAPDGPISFGERILTYVGLLIGEQDIAPIGRELDASNQVIRFVARHRSLLPAEIAEQLMALGESLRQSANSAADGSDGRSRYQSEIQGEPGIYVYALPHYLRHPVAPSADDLDADRTLMKVGKSDNDTIRRFRQQQRSTEVPEDPQLLRVYVGDGSSYAMIERQMHDLIRAADHRQARGRVSGTEWFLTSLKFLDAIASSLGLSPKDLDSDSRT